MWPYPEYAAVAYAARKVGRPVKWLADRSETFLSDNHGRDHVSEASLAIDAEHRFTAMRIRTYANIGAYISNFGAAVPGDVGRAHADRRVPDPAARPGSADDVHQHRTRSTRTAAPGVRRRAT